MAIHLQPFLVCLRLKADVQVRFLPSTGYNRCKRTCIGRSSNGKTADSGSAYRGSSPCLPAIDSEGFAALGASRLGGGRDWCRSHTEERPSRQQSLTKYLLYHQTTR